MKECDKVVDPDKNVFIILQKYCTEHQLNWKNVLVTKMYVRKMPEVSQNPNFMCVIYNVLFIGVKTISSSNKISFKCFCYETAFIVITKKDDLNYFLTRNKS